LLFAICWVCPFGVMINPLQRVTPGLDDVSRLAASSQAVQKALPVGSDEESILQCEKLFKDLYVRSSMKPENRCRQSSQHLKGTLQLNDMKTGLMAILQRDGVAAAHIDEIIRVCEVAFRASQASVAGVSAGDEETIDMNQFHGVVGCLSHHLLLWDTLLQVSDGEFWGSDPNTWCITYPVFRKVLDAMLASSQAEVGVWKFWKEDPTTAFKVVSEGDPSGIRFNMLLQRSLLHVLDERALSNGSRTSCRKRAYQLLQALNNTPSLPNAVPKAGSTLSARDRALSGQEGPKLTIKPGACSYKTTYGQSFPAQSPREPDSPYRQAKTKYAGDIEWRVHPFNQRSSRLQMAGAAIGS